MVNVEALALKYGHDVAMKVMLAPDDAMSLGVVKEDLPLVENGRNELYSASADVRHELKKKYTHQRTR